MVGMSERCMDFVPCLNALPNYVEIFAIFIFTLPCQSKGKNCRVRCRTDSLVCDIKLGVIQASLEIFGFNS